MKVTFLNHSPTPKEIAAYRAHAMQSQPTAEEVLVDFDGDDAVLTYRMPVVPFERIRRITGYLVGTTDRWNNAKSHELNDRVTHRVDADTGIRVVEV